MVALRLSGEGSYALTTIIGLALVLGAIAVSKAAGGRSRKGAGREMATLFGDNLVVGGPAASCRFRLGRTSVEVARAYTAPDVFYGTMCLLSEPGTRSLCRILSDVELTADRYTAADVTGLTRYDFYMVPDAFREFAAALCGPNAAPALTVGPASGDAAVPRQPQVFQASRPVGVRQVLALVGGMLGLLLLLGAIWMAVSSLVPESEDYLLMALVLALPIASASFILVMLRRGSGRYAMEIATDRIVFVRDKRTRRITMRLPPDVVLPVNWVASGRDGLYRMGPAIEVMQVEGATRLRIGTMDPDRMWEGSLTEVSGVDFSLSRDGWNALLDALEAAGMTISLPE